MIANLLLPHFRNFPLKRCIPVFRISMLEISVSTSPHHLLHTTSSNPAMNCYGVDLLPPSLQGKLFKTVKKAEVVKTQPAQSAVSELKKFGLDTSGSSFPLPDITQHLPPIVNNNVSDHFLHIAGEQVQPYTDLLFDLLASDTPPLPATWCLEPGWTRYNEDGSYHPVPYPTERCCVFDVEVCVSEDPRAVMATAVTSDAWYSWLSPYLVTTESFPSSMSPSTMIPMGSDESPRLVIGHNVSYDRIRVGDEYRIDKSGTKYLDTMSMHIAVSGMTSSQRLAKMACKNMTKEELKHKPRWLANTSMNSLADIHKFYCNTIKELDKDPRNSFVKLGLPELMRDCANLLSYCAGDVGATLDVLRVLFPLFSQHCPHPASLSGMLTMSTSFLPTSSCWENFIKSSNDAYTDLEKEMMKLVETEAELAVKMIMDSSYKNDPWLWNLEWKIASKKTIKGRRMNKIHEKKVNLLEMFEDGYPAWYQDLSDEDDGRVFMNLSTGKRVVPKLLRLTWKGYPMHHDKVEKWGYLIPTSDAEEIAEKIEYGEIVTNFPLQMFLDVVNKDRQDEISKIDSMEVDPETYLSNIEEHGDEHTAAVGKGKQSLHKKVGKTDEVGIDIGIPGVRFCGLPHKNGPKFRVGNPLSKDFISSAAEGGELASYKENLAQRLLQINMCLSYWRSSRDRIREQIKVDFDLEDLPSSVKCHEDYEEGGEYGAIVPAMTVAGTITRRAVEKTWLTASNAKSDRIGSELKCYIRAPPGYHLVGADVDSQELWLAAVLGDAKLGGHGATALGWMCLQGEKSKGTDLHSKTAAAAQVTRDQAKILNYGRIYGAGEPFAKLLLMQFNPGITELEAAKRARHMYAQTKGSRGYKLNSTGAWLYDRFNVVDGEPPPYSGWVVERSTMYTLGNLMALIKILVQESIIIKDGNKRKHRHILTSEGSQLYSAVNDSEDNTDISDDELVMLTEYLQTKYKKKVDGIKGDYDTRESLVKQVVWSGGSESHTFNRLEEIAMSRYPKTPVLGAEITRALDSKLIGRNYLTSRINWVVQSSAVDYLHLMLVAVEWLFKEMGIRGRFCLSIHDEIRYMVVSEDRYKASLALHMANLLVRCEVCAKLGLDNLPASTAFFSSVDIDKVMRKEPSTDCVTPSNPDGLERGHGIGRGDGLDIWQTLDKIRG